MRNEKKGLELLIYDDFKCDWETGCRCFDRIIIGCYFRNFVKRLEKVRKIHFRLHQSSFGGKRLIFCEYEVNISNMKNFEANWSANGECRTEFMWILSIFEMSCCKGNFDYFIKMKNRAKEASKKREPKKSLHLK